MCFDCDKEIGVPVGWYEVPPNIIRQITEAHPGRHPLTYVKATHGFGPDSLGFTREEPLNEGVILEFGWYDDCSECVRRHSPAPRGNYVTIIGNQHWILRAYYRRYYANFINKIRRYQKEIRRYSEVRQGYCSVEFPYENWEYSIVTIRHRMSGGPDWKVELRSRKQLFDYLEESLRKIKAKKYPED